jgi:acyl-CoA synthetase (AMP-forming)/AMP-acid ligase II
VRGATVYPSEVERALHALPAVRRAYVVDVVGPGGGTEVAAVVVLADDAVSATVDELASGAKERLSSFKVPTRWCTIAGDDVPMTTTGKVDKAGLQHLFDRGDDA